MSKPVCIVWMNEARVYEQALARALPAEDPFWTTPGITVLPHIGGLHPARDEGVAEVFVANARRFLAGESLATLVDRARGY